MEHFFLTEKSKQRPKAKPRDSDNPGGATVGESVMKMMGSKKKLSSKINYAIADSLFGGKSKGKGKQKEAPPVRKQNKGTPTPKNFHTSLLGGEGEDEEDDDEEEEEEGVVMAGEEIEFAMLKRDAMVRDEDEDEGWGEEL